MNVSDRCRRTALTGSAIAVGLGLLTLIGWTMGIEALASVRGKDIPMAPRTAAEFLMSSVAILLLGRRAVGALAVGVAGVATVVMLGYLSGTPLLYGATIIPVALPTALAFLCVSMALIAVAGPEVWPLRPMLGDSTRALLLRAFLPVTVGLILLFGVLQTLLQGRFI